MYTIIYENERGQRVEFGASPTIKAVNFEGFGEVEAVIQSQRAPYRDGSRFIDSLLAERALSIEFLIEGTDYAEVSGHRRQISRVFNPKLRGQVTAKVAGQTYIIDVIPEHVPTFPKGPDNQSKRHQFGVIDLIAHNPYWRDPQEVSRALQAYQGLFIFPFSFPVEFGVSGDTTILENTGDTETPVTIDIQGPVVRPRVINKTTGEYIVINRSLSANEVMHIDTNVQSKRVEIYREGWAIEKAMGYLDHTSDFWQLQPGRNEIQYIADSGGNDAIVAVAWHNQFTGI